MRRVTVEPVSARTELEAIVRLSAVIVIGVWMYLATDSQTLRDPVGGRNLLPYQALIRDRPATEQRVFRELQEGLLEAEVRRAADGRWPAVASLAAEGIPPFAFDPTTKGGRYDWRLTQTGTFVNYLGIPQQGQSPAWMLFVLEPDALAPPDPSREDEEHHRLSTGSILHVSTWVRSDGHAARRIVRTPQAEGWTQLYAVGPSVTAFNR